MAVFSVKEIQEYSVTTDLGKKDGPYVPCRPEDGPLLWRIVAAWGVLTGKYDALDWGPGQRNESDQPNDLTISGGQ